MKFLFAPDSFKGSISAIEATEMLAVAAKKIFGSIETIGLPVADGGEGTVDSFVIAAGGEYRSHVVTGPMNKPTVAKYGLINSGEVAVIEMAQSSGLPLVPANLRDPLKATSKGTGELIAHVLDAGITELIIGIGGSATNDGGMGVLSALGAKFYDKDGNLLYGCGEDLERVYHIDLTGMHSAIKKTSITVICDVVNPLLGENGATYIYGRQKGADDLALERLEAGMDKYAHVFFGEQGINIASFDGAGAAGGMGGVLKGVLGAQLKPGIEAVLDAVAFDKLLAGVDLVVTGEGCLDGQSVKFGKVPTGIAKRCNKLGIPVAIIVGGMGEGADDIYQIADVAIMTTINAAMPIDKAMDNAKHLFESAADRLFRSIKMGMSISEKDLKNSIK